MNFVITAANGLVGSRLSEHLATSGHAVTRFVRRPSRDDEFVWNPDADQIPTEPLEHADVVVHLAGQNIAGARWTETVKRGLRDSRVVSTRRLSETLARLRLQPKTFICASAVGGYGDRGDEVLTESSALGSGFLPELCAEWEAACEPAIQAGVRVVNVRIGVILTPAGGALQKMLPLFRAGLGGVLGSGQQYLSWISLADVLGAIEFIARTESIRGPVNLTAPEPVTNREFTRSLAAALHRPALLPAPAWGLRLAMGEMADALLLASLRVIPQKLQAAGYDFHHASLDPAWPEILSADAGH